MSKRGLVLGAALIGAFLGAVIGLGVDQDPSVQGGLTVRIVESKLGTIALMTKPGASCQALVGLPAIGVPAAANRPHRMGEPLVAGPDGIVRWRYLASAPGARGVVSHTVSCTYAGLTVGSRTEFELSGEED